jgi:hypothetical protein
MTENMLRSAVGKGLLFLVSRPIPTTAGVEGADLPHLIGRHRIAGKDGSDSRNNLKSRLARGLGSLISYPVPLSTTLIGSEIQHAAGAPFLPFANSTFASLAARVYYFRHSQRRNKG